MNLLSGLDEMLSCALFCSCSYAIPEVRYWLFNL